MKKYLFTLLLCISAFAKAQAPQGVNYQAVIRDGNGNPTVNQNVGIKFTIRNSSSSVVYAETHTITTNAFGLVNLIIGQGTIVSGTFNSIDWGNGAYNIELAVDNTGGTNYVTMGTPQPFMSVPYALYALKSGSGGSSGGADTPYTAGTGISISNRVITNTGDLSNTNEIQSLSTSGNNITLSNGGGTVAIPTQVYKINNSNISSYTALSDRIIFIEGSITLNSNFNEFCTNHNYIYGGSITGTGQTMCLGNYVITGTTFNNLKLTGTNTQFINCTFNNMTDLPFDCVLINCKINNSTLTTSTTRIIQMSDSKVNGSSLPRVQKVVNSFIYGGSTLGSASEPTTQVSNCNFNDSYTYLGYAFTGNYLDNSTVYIKPTTTSTVCTGNSFESTSISNFIDVDVTSSSVKSITISGNSFRGNTTTPSSSHIKLSGSYGGTRFMCKVSGNNFIGGTGVCVSNSMTGNADLTVSDNDLLVTGGLGVSNGGLVFVRNNQSH